MIAPDSKTANGAPPSAGVVIDHGRHAVVRVHLQELRRELVAAADVARDDLVGDRRLFQQDRDLLPVGRWPVMQVDHVLCSLWFGVSAATLAQSRHLGHTAPGQ